MEKTEGGLKHLGFVRVFAVNTVLILSNLYNYAKQNSGSLKSAVESVENGVTAVVGPVYGKGKEISENSLTFVDKKVDELASPLTKKVFLKADQLVQKVLDARNGFVNQVKLAPYTAIDLVSSFVKKYASRTLHFLGCVVNRYPVLRAGKDMALPTVSHWSEKYNKFITKMPARGYHVFAYFPKVPIDDILAALVEKKDD